MNAQIGNTVRVHYTGRLEDGSQFDSSIGRDPLEFRVGDGMVIPGFEEGIITMQIGEKKTVRIPAAHAYGARREELCATIDRAQFPPDITPEIGLQLSLPQPDGGVMVITITNVTPETVTLDANHKLAGKDLTFDIELVEIVS